MKKDGELSLFKRLSRGFLMVTGGLAVMCTIPIKVSYSGTCKKELDLDNVGVIVSNHTQWLDGVLYSLVFRKRKIKHLIAKEVYKNKITEFGLDCLGGVKIDRENITPAVYNDIVKGITKGDIICVFPEGKINDGGELLEFKESAALFSAFSHKSVIPCYKSRAQVFKRTDIVIGKPENYYDYYKTLSKDGISGFSEILRGKVAELKKSI